MQLGASSNVARTGGDEPAPGVGSKIFTLGVETAVLCKPSNWTCERTWHFVTVHIHQSGKDLGQNPRTDLQIFFENKGMWLPCLNVHRCFVLQLVVSDTERSLSNLFRGPGRCAVAEVSAVNIPYHASTSDGRVSPAIDEVRREVLCLENAKGEAGNFNGCWDTGDHRDVVRIA